jgi:hypothetical protein
MVHSGSGTMNREWSAYEQAQRANEQRVEAVTPDDGEDWPLLLALLAGLTVALIANTFLSLIPG